MNREICGGTSSLLTAKLEMMDGSHEDYDSLRVVDTLGDAAKLDLSFRSEAENLLLRSNLQSMSCRCA